MTARWKARRARRRLKAHTLGVSDRHNKTTAWLKKRERTKLERRRANLPDTPRYPRLRNGRLAQPVEPALERPSLADQLRAAVRAGLLPAPSDKDTDQ